MAINFTSEQRSAIDIRNSSLIVSAAAGSGKTAVLVERVMSMIIGGEADISDLIVVTFTEAAASEMKNKITSAILKELEERPKNKQLLRQLSLMSQAKIQTVHSFCSGVIKNNFHRCGIAYDFSMLDDSEKTAVTRDIIDELFEERYKNFDTNLDFKELFNNYSTDRGDEALKFAVLELYEKLRSHPNPKKWCEYAIKTADGFKEDNALNHNWGKFIFKEAEAIHNSELESLKRAYEDMKEVAPVFEKYKQGFKDAIDVGEIIRESFKDGWDSVFESLRDFEKTNLKPCKYEDKEYTARLRNIRARYFDVIEELKSKYICIGSEYMADEFGNTAPVVKELCRLVMDFEERFSKEKLKRNVLDYSDLEHMALSLLYDSENGKRTEIAEKISEESYELLVDEFQDTNEIQDRIFECIKPKTDNLFYVGDVKQSIYKFRLASPSIFIDKYKSAAPLKEAEKSRNIRIDLNKNFRSRQEVLSAVNFVFESIMTEDFGGIMYDSSQALHLGAVYEGEVPSEFTVIDMSLRDIEDEEKKAKIEAEYTAQRIYELLESFETEENGEKRRARPSDFAILLSSYANKSPYYQNALRQWGIPCAVSKKSNFLKSTEIATVLAALKVIDNPYQDIPLAALMHSVMYSFMPDEIAHMRILQPKGYLYDGLLKMAAAGEKKAAGFIEDMNKYREMSREMPVFMLVERLYEDYSLKTMFVGFENGEERCENLDSVLNIAESYESGEYKGLFRFIEYFETKYKENTDDGAVSGEGVAIMSIHKSKGLEFPIVFLPDMDKSFNRQDTKKDVLFHEDLQIGIKYKDKNQMQVYKSLNYLAISAKIQKEQTEEEMRKLYVAMTRAKEKLVMICSLSNAEKKIKEMAEEVEYGITPLIASNSRSFSQWLIYSYLHHKDANILRGYTGWKKPMIKDSSGKIDFSIISPDSIEIPASVDVLKNQDEKKAAEIPSYMEKEYRYKELTELPSKLSPSMIKLLKGNKESSFKSNRDTQHAAERGNAIHHFMEKLDFEKCSDIKEIEEQGERLYQEGILDKAEKKYIDYAAVCKMFKSDIGRYVKNSQSIKKEQQFAALFTPDEILGNGITEDTIVVNGVIDLLIFADDYIVIADYKSDYVKEGFEQEAALRHKEQIDIYSRAAEKMYNKKVKERYIYLFSSGKAVKI